jgi:hypothetical protein
MPKNKPENAEKSIEDLEAEVLESIQETEELTTLGFQQDENGLVIRGGNFKAHLKDCANQIKDEPGVKIKALRAKVANKVYIQEYFVPIFKNGSQCKEPDNQFGQAIQVMTRQGPRSALKRIKYIWQPTVEFTLLLRPDKEVTLEVVKKIFDYGSVHGFGGERGMGEGRYEFMVSEK